MKRRVVFLIVSVITLCFGNLKAWDMENSLTPAQQKIVTIAANTAVGDLDQLRTELHAGLDVGLSVNQIKEVLIQMYAYAGFPRSLQGINTFMAVLDERKAKGINDSPGREASPVPDTGDKYTRGREVLEKLTLTDQKNITGANAFAPTIDRFLKEHLFADIFERDVLTYFERELATISALSAMQGVEPMLQSHKRMGMNVGITEAQLRQTTSPAGTRADTRENSLFPIGEPNDPAYFTGEVYLQPLVGLDESDGYYSAGSVTFMPGARTHRHTHPSVQTLIVTEGEGWYQEWGKEAVKLRKGSVIPIPAGVEHWHGASKDSKLVHIAITNFKDGSAVTWMDPVTDEEYGNVGDKR